MAGLLYKDFMAAKGKIWVTVILAGMITALLLKVLIPTETVNFIVFSICVCMIAFLYMAIIGQLEISVVCADEKRKQMQYYLSLPVSKKEYVASKYIFLLLAFGIALTVSMMLCSICRINCPYNDLQEILMQLTSMVPIFTCVFLWIPTFEIPFFMGFGFRKGNQIRTGFLVLLFFLCFVYFMFGDLTIFDRLNLVSILNYLKNHQNVLLILQAFMPYVTFLLYYLSYRISCVLFERKEWEDD